VQLTTSDGHLLDADVAEPPDGVAHRGGVVVCHPHPQYGGNRFNNVVAELFGALPTAGFETLRFDFRSEHGGGVAERLDVVAALDELKRAGRAPLFVAGYSFGAAVALATPDERIAAIAAIAPPLTMTPVPQPTVPVLVLSPAHDQFCPPAAAGEAAEGWPAVELDTIESTDHFLLGQTAWVAERVTSWLTSHA
jgi:alpha/beta superfamily hydrolase